MDNIYYLQYVYIHYYIVIYRRKYNIYVTRVSNNQYKYSRPCANCLIVLKSIPNISNVYYTVDNDHYVCEKITNMTSNYICCGSRYIKKLYNI